MKENNFKKCGIPQHEKENEKHSKGKFHPKTDHEGPEGSRRIALLFP